MEDLLVAAKLEQGELATHMAAVDLRAAVEEAVVRLRPRARLADADIELDLRADVSALANAAQLGRILDNLLNNALTYSGGSPWLRVSVGLSESAHPSVTVEDHGKGIPERLSGQVSRPGFARRRSRRYPTR